jgi:hypothetical protein
MANAEFGIAELFEWRMRSSELGMIAIQSEERQRTTDNNQLTFSTKGFEHGKE